MRLLAVQQNSTMVYQPSPNGMIERLRHQLKASLTALLNRDRWTNYLPTVLLWLRSSLNRDLGCTIAELVYATGLPLLKDFFMPTNDYAFLKLGDYLCHLQDLFRTSISISLHQPMYKEIFISPNLPRLLTRLPSS